MEPHSLMAVICRLCARRGYACVDIFGEEGGRARLERKIRLCLPIHVKADEELPRQVCLDCIQKLDVSYELYCSCVGAQATIKRMLGIVRHRVMDAGVGTVVGISLPDIGNREVPLSQFLAASEDIPAEPAVKRACKEDGICQLPFDGVTKKISMKPVVGVDVPVADGPPVVGTSDGTHDASQLYIGNSVDTMSTLTGECTDVENPTFMVTADNPPTEAGNQLVCAVGPQAKGPRTEVVEPAAHFSVADKVHSQLAYTPVVPLATAVHKQAVHIKKAGKPDPQTYVIRRPVLPLSALSQPSPVSSQATSTATVPALSPQSSAVTPTRAAAPTTACHQLAATTIAISSVANAPRPATLASSSSFLMHSQGVSCVPEARVVYSSCTTGKSGTSPAVQPGPVMGRCKPAASEQQLGATCSRSCTPAIPMVQIRNYPAMCRQAPKSHAHAGQVHKAQVHKNPNVSVHVHQQKSLPHPKCPEPCQRHSVNTQGVTTVHKKEQAPPAGANQTSVPCQPEREKKADAEEVVCEHCNKAFPEHILVHHRVLHFRKRFFSCISCGKNFQTEIGLNHHRCGGN